MKHIVIVCPKDKIIDKGITRTRALVNDEWVDVVMDTSNWLSKKFWHIDSGEDIYSWNIKSLNSLMNSMPILILVNGML